MTDRPTTVEIAARFNGPRNSANGGYACGAAAALISGDAEVRLHTPPPLDTPMTVSETDEGIFLHDGDTLVARARVRSPTIEVPAPPTEAEAKDARTRYTGATQHALPHCFVCGPGRAPDDGLHLFTGPHASRPLVAAEWRPSPSHLDAAGHIDPRIVWAALDCPSYFGLQLPGNPLALLGQMCASVPEPVPGDRTLIVYGWSTGSEGRKHFSGAAMADTSGHVWAHAEHIWIAMPPGATA